MHTHTHTHTHTQRWKQTHTCMHTPKHFLRKGSHKHIYFMKKKEQIAVLFHTWFLVPYEWKWPVTRRDLSSFKSTMIIEQKRGSPGSGSHWQGNMKGKASEKKKCCSKEMWSIMRVVPFHCVGGGGGDYNTDGPILNQKTNEENLRVKHCLVKILLSAKECV